MYVLCMLNYGYILCRNYGGASICDIYIHIYTIYIVYRVYMIHMHVLCMPSYVYHNMNNIICIQNIIC